MWQPYYDDGTVVIYHHDIEPTRIRLAWVSDDDIAEAVERYGPPQDGRPSRVVPS